MMGPLQAKEPAMNLRVRIARTLAFVLLAGVAGLAAVAAARAGDVHPKVPKNVRLYIFDCGTIKGLDPALFNFKREEIKSADFVVPCFLIVDPRGTLMWDVGVIPDEMFKDDGKPVTQGPSTATRTLKSQLAEIGYAPEDITYLAHSHYHGDHIANSNEFAASTWLVRPVERDAMFAEKPPQLVDPKMYDKLKNAQTVLITKDEYDVFGDGKVIIKSAPGHTPGHQVLILHFKHTGNVMLAGDLYHYPEERFSGRVPTFEYNKEQSLASRAMIEDYCKKTKTQLWIEHDYLGNMKLKKSPKFYD